MNTLNKEITSSFFITPNGYQDLLNRWSEIVNSDKKNALKPEHYLLYAILRGKDWRKGFSVPKKQDPSWTGKSSIAALNAIFSAKKIAWLVAIDAPFGLWWVHNFGDIVDFKSMAILKHIINDPYLFDVLKEDAYIDQKEVN